jgi:hypothetical protein
MVLRPPARQTNGAKCGDSVDWGDPVTACLFPDQRSGEDDSANLLTSDDGALLLGRSHRVCLRTGYGLGILFWMKRGNHRLRISSDDSEKGPRRCFGRPAAAFPMFHRVQAEAESIGKSGLSHTQPLADILHIDFCGQTDLITLCFPIEEGANFSQSLL